MWPSKYSVFYDHIFHVFTSFFTVYSLLSTVLYYFIAINLLSTVEFANLVSKKNIFDYVTLNTFNLTVCQVGNISVCDVSRDLAILLGFAFTFIIVAKVD